MHTHEQLNVVNIQYMINVMKSATRLDMVSFQETVLIDESEDRYTPFADTVEDLHACGNTACFAGYMAVSPKFRAEGGWQSLGCPEFETEDGTPIEGSKAVAYWLGIPAGLAEAIVNGHTISIFEDERSYPVGYWKVFKTRKEFESLKPEGMIEILDNILIHGPDFYRVKE